jgi:hypothetical protein
LLLLDGQVHHDTHVIPKGNYVIGMGNYLSARPSDLGNYVSADMRCGLHGPTLQVADCFLAFDKPVDGVWPTDHFGLAADL